MCGNETCLVRHGDQVVAEWLYELFGPQTLDVAVVREALTGYRHAVLWAREALPAPMVHPPRRGFGRDQPPTGG